jgi:hypothetical protein
MSKENKECDVIKEDNGQYTNGDMVLMIGMFAVMPLLGLGLIGQSLIAITQGGLLAALSLLSLVLGLGGLALSFSKEKHGFNIGVSLITVAAALSFLFEYIAVVPDGAFTINLIATGTLFALFLAAINFIMKQGNAKNTPLSVS